MQPFFSILIPVYNQVGLMDHCIASLKAQTFPDFEVIFVNDGSTDGSQAMLEEYCREDSRFRAVAHERNRSLVTARYTGMQNARGQYILFLDSDDWLDEDTCETLHAYLAEKPVDLLRFGFVEEPDGKEYRADVEYEDPLDAQMNSLISPALVKNCCSAALVARALERTHPFYCNMSEDVYWSSIMFSSAQSFGRIDRTFYHYLQGVGMSTQKRTTPAALARSVKSIVDMSRELYAYMEVWCPKYLDKARERIGIALRYTLTNAVFPETDFYAIAEMLHTVNQPDCRGLFEDACRDLLPLTARRIWGISNEVLEQLGLECPPITWFSKDVL